MKRKIIHFDRNEAGNLHCDACGYDLPGSVTWGRHLIGHLCPICGANMLTERDFRDTDRMFAFLDWLNRWFSWLPFVATADLSDPRLRRVGAKMHNGNLEISADVPSVPKSSQGASHED